MRVLGYPIMASREVRTGQGGNIPAMLSKANFCHLGRKKMHTTIDKLETMSDTLQKQIDIKNG